MSKIQKFLTTIAITIVFFAVAGLGLYYIIDEHIRPIAGIGEGTPLSDFFKKETEELRAGWGEKENVNFLMLGIDSEGLTDTIIFANINLETGDANMFSIPRDLWVSVGGESFHKINALYNMGEDSEGNPDVERASIIREKIEEITGKEVHNTAIIDISGIKEMVDMVGGVETKEGFMDGSEALSYIRDRSTEGGDFDRMQKQQEVLVAIMKKIEDDASLQEPDAALNIYRHFQKHLAHDASFVRLIRLFNLLDQTDANTDNVGMHTITTENLLYSDFTQSGELMLYTLHPNAGSEDYSEIQEFIQKTINQ